MANPTRYQVWRQPILNGTLGQADEPEPDPDPEDPIDYASAEQGGTVQVAIDVGSVALVQEANGAAGVVSGSVSATFGATPTLGNMLIAVLFNRGTTNSPVTPSGWTRHPDCEVIGTGFDGGKQTLFYKVAGASEATVVTVTTSAHNKSLYIAEWSGLAAPAEVLAVSNEASTTSMTVGSITPTDSSGVLFAGFNQSSRQATLTMGSGFTESFTDIIDASGPSQVFGYKIVDPFSGSYSATCSSDELDAYGAYIVAFPAATDELVWYPAPAANDGDTATSSLSNSSADPTMRVILLDDRLIYRMELDVGTETAGATVFELYGSDDPTMVTTTLLATLSFTATGSYTLDAESVSWIPTASYPFFQLEHVSGGGDREFYEVRLFSAVGVGGVTDHGALTGRDDAEQHPADSVSYDNGTSGLTATDVQAAIDEVVAGGGSGLTVEDEGTPLSTAATTLDFVGTGVTASGTGATKTITIPGGGTPTFVGARAYNSTTQTVTANTETTMLFDTDQYDTNSIHDTGSNTGRMTTHATGYWYFQASIYVVGAVGLNPGYMYLRVDGTTAIIGSERDWDDTQPVPSQMSSCVVYLTSGQYVEARHYAPGTSRGATTGGLSNVFEARYLGT